MEQIRAVQGSPGSDEFVVCVRIACSDKRFAGLDGAVSCRADRSLRYGSNSITATASCDGRCHQVSNSLE